MFVPGRPFQPSVMFVRKVGTNPSEAPQLLLGRLLAYHEHYTIPERPIRLILTLQKLRRKKDFVVTSPGAYPQGGPILQAPAFLANIRIDQKKLPGANTS